MNMKTTKFLAVLAVFAMAFAALAVVLPSEQNDADAKDIVKFDETVDFSAYYGAQAGTYATKNVDLGNAIYVDKNLKSTYPIYTVKGVLQYWASQEVATQLGMTTNTFLVFNWTITAGNYVVITNTNAQPSEAGTSLAKGTTTEPCMIGATATSGTYFLWEKAPNAATWTLAAEIITADPTTEGDPDTGLIKLAAGAEAEILADSTITTDKASVIVNKDVTISAAPTGGATRAAAGAVLTLSNAAPNLYVAPGCTLTIKIQSSGIANDNTVMGIKASDASSNLKIYGIGEGAAIKVEDSATLASNYTNTKVMLSSIGLYSNALTINNLKFNAYGSDSTKAPNDWAAGIYAYDDLTIVGSDVNIIGGNRAIYAVDAMIVSGNSDIDVSGKEYGIRSKALTVGSNPVTSNDVTTYDRTTVDAILVGKSGNQDPDEYFGIKAKGTVTIKAGATVTADAIEILNDGASTVDGTLKITGSDYAGYSVTTGTGATAVTTVYQPSGLVIVDTIGSTSSETDYKKITAIDKAILYIGADGQVNVDAGAAILGIIANPNGAGTTDDDVASFGAVTTATEDYAPKFVVVEDDATFTAGSVVITGSFSTETDGTIVVNGTAKISGVLDVPLKAANNAEIIIPAGETLTITAGNYISTQSTGASGEKYTLNVVGTLKGDGKIKTDVTNATPVVYASNPESITSMLDAGITVSTDYEEMDVSSEAYNSLEEQQAFLNDHSRVKLKGGDITIKKGEKLTLPSTLVFNLNGNKIIIDKKEGTTAAGELIVNGAKIVDTTATTIAALDSIQVSGILTLDAADVCVDVKVIYDANYQPIGYVSIKNAKSMTIMNDLTSDVSVGYGNTLTLSGLDVPAGKKVDAFGTLIIEETTEVKSGANINVYKYAKATINGNLNVVGNVSVLGTVTNNGSITVSNTDGGAVFGVAGMGTMYNNGKIDVSKAKSTATDENALVVKSVYNYGEMKITGTLKGTVIDYGTMTFNGKSDNATITLTDGISVKISSVDGTITINDSKYCIADAWNSTFTALKEKVMVSAGNSVELTDVKNVTVSNEVITAIKEGKWDDETANIKIFTSNLGISGSINDIGDLLSTPIVTITGSGVFDWLGKDDDPARANPYSQATKGEAIIGDVSLGKGVSMLLNTYVNVDGTLTVTAEDSYLATATGAAVDINGTVIIGYDSAVIDYVLDFNATVYVLEDADANDTYYYTTFVAATEQIGVAYDNTIYVLGENKLKTDVKISEGSTVKMLGGSKLTIDAKATLEIDAEALFDASEANEVVVDGILIIYDKNNAIRSANNLTYQVYGEVGIIATYSGILGALEHAVAGQTITLEQDIEIKKSFTVKEGVILVVPTGKTLTVNAKSSDVKATINGELQLQRDATLDLKKNGTNKIQMAINGVVKVDDSAILKENGTAKAAGVFYEQAISNDYVKFAKTIDGRGTMVYSNLTYAATVCDDGTITAVGAVTAGDITLTKGATKTELKLTMTEGTKPYPSSIKVSSITLDGADLVLGNYQYSTFTGDVYADSYGVVANIELYNAYYLTIESDFIVEATGNIDVMYLKGTPVGYLSVEAGIVEINGETTLNGAAGTGSEIGDNATLVVPKGKKLTLVGTADYPVLVSGILSIADGAELDMTGYVVDAGAIYIASSTQAELTGTLQVLGILTVSEEEDMKALAANTNAVIIVGAAPEALGAAGDATIIGPIDIDANSYMLVFEGDISEAKINYTASLGTYDVSATDFFINDVLYVTAISKGVNNVKLIDSTATSKTVITKQIDLIGLNTTGINVYANWLDENDKKLSDGKNKIGEYEDIFFYAKAAQVEGTVTVGYGVYAYVDGKLIESFITHDDQTSTLISVGTHVLTYEVINGYDASSVSVLFNGKTIPVTASGLTFTITPDMETFTLSLTGATPIPEPEPVTPEEKSEWTITTILLCVLVVLIAIMAVIVALRLNRN